MEFELLLFKVFFSNGQNAALLKKIEGRAELVYYGDCYAVTDICYAFDPLFS